MKFTVYTPTYNRTATLPRVYESLKRQTFKDFIWLVVDDGSTDHTSELVNTWIKEDIIKINYVRKNNGGKTSALKVVYEMANTKYIIGIDSDDELAENAVEVFYKEWIKIEEAGLEDSIASIRALNMNNNHKISYGYGNYHIPDDVEFIDSSWQEFVLKNGNNNECIVSENLLKIRECSEIEDEFWLSEKVNTIGDLNLAARLGRKYKSRLIKNVLSVVHYDEGDSLLRTKDFVKQHYNSVVLSYFFLNENMNYFFWNKKYFVGELFRFSVSTLALKLSFKEVLRNITDNRFKILFISFYPMSFAMNFYYKHFKSSYWF